MRTTAISLVLIFLNILPVFADITKFMEAKPHIFTKDSYSQEAVKKQANYAAPVAQFKTYDIYMQVGQPTEVHCPFPIRFSEIDMRFFYIKETIDKKTLIIRPEISAELNKNSTFSKEFLAKSLYNNTHSLLIAMENNRGESLNISFHIQVSKTYYNQKVIIYNPEEDTLSNQTSAYLKNQLEKKEAVIMAGYNREKTLHFGDFKRFKIAETKTYKNSAVTFVNFNSAGDYFYCNLKISGTALYPLTKKDIHLKIQPFGFFWFMETLGIEDTLELVEMISYPDIHSEKVPEKDVINGVENSEILLTIRFKKTPELAEQKQLYLNLFIKGQTVQFTKKLFLQEQNLRQLSFVRRY